MKKLLVTLALAGTLSVPSVVFAEAGWYGSLRSGLQFGGGEDAKLVDAYSRFGIKGSNEVSDGLSAVYRFETKINTTNANLDGGRLSYVGLSGGFGTITIGQIWGASYNHTGGVFDLANFGGDHHSTGRVGNALSYSISAGSVSAQVDAIMNSEKNSSGGIDQFEFGMSFDMGDIGKVALSHTNIRDVNMPKMVDLTPSTINAGGTNETYRVTLEGSGATAKIKKEGVWRDKTTREIVDNPTIMVAHVYDVDATAQDPSDLISVTPMVIFHSGTALEDPAATARKVANIKKIGGKYYNSADTACTAAAAATDCTTAQLVWVHSQLVESEAGKAPDAKMPTLTAYTDAAASLTHTATATVTDVTPGQKASHVAVQFNLGAMTAHLGASQIKMNDMANKTKVTHFGVNGGLGDTGMSFYAAGRNIKAADGMKSTPWVIGLNRKLGDGAKVWLEHENLDNGKSGRTTVGLNVDF